MKKQHIRRQVLQILVGLSAIWLFLWLLGPILLPFAAGLAVAKAATPMAHGLCRRLRLPRWAAVGVCVSGIYGGILALLWLLCKLLCREAMAFVRALPDLTMSLQGTLTRLELQLLRLAGRFPDGIGQALTDGLSEFFRSSTGLAGRVYEGLFTFASSILRKTPDIALFILTAVLSGFMITSELPNLQALWQKKIPPVWQSRLQRLADRAADTLGAWIKTQAKLIFISFLAVTAGLVILQVDYPLLFGLVIALVDALPVLGSGTVLIPWGLLQFLQGNTVLGTGLLVLYGGVTLLRAALEPRMLGRQMGLPPLLTLLALYGGYRILGIWGMILFPMAALLIKQFWSPAEKRIDN